MLCWVLDSHRDFCICIQWPQLSWNVLTPGQSHLKHNISWCSYIHWSSTEQWLVPFPVIGQCLSQIQMAGYQDPFTPPRFPSLGKHKSHFDVVCCHLRRWLCHSKVFTSNVHNFWSHLYLYRHKAKLFNIWIFNSWINHPRHKISRIKMSYIRRNTLPVVSFLSYAFYIINFTFESNVACNVTGYRLFPTRDISNYVTVSWETNLPYAKNTDTCAERERERERERESTQSPARSNS